MQVRWRTNAPAVLDIYTNLSVRVSEARTPFSAFRFQKHRVLPRFSRFSGHFAGLSAAPNAFETTRFHAFFAIFASSRNRRFSWRFFEKVAKTTCFHAFLKARVGGSGLAFSSFSRDVSSETCQKPRVFTRFSRFSDRVVAASFFILVLIRFSSLFSKCCENHAFSRVFRDSVANLVCVFKLPNLKFGVSRANVRVQMTFGSFRGTSAPQKLIKNNAFSRVFCVSVPSKPQRVLPCVFRKCCENHAFSHVFQTVGGTVLCLLFRCFCSLAFQKRHPKLILGISRAMRGPKKMIF